MKKIWINAEFALNGCYGTSGFINVEEGLSEEEIEEKVKHSIHEWIIDTIDYSYTTSELHEEN